MIRVLGDDTGGRRELKYVSSRGAAPVLEFGDVLLSRPGPRRWPLPARDLADAGRRTPSRAPRRPATSTPPSRSCGPSSRAASTATSSPRSWPTPTPRSTIPTSCRCATSATGSCWPSCSTGRRWRSRTSPSSWSGRLFAHELERRGERVTIVGATSGDTGSAAIDACRDRPGIEIVILHPARPGLGGAAPADDDGRRPQRAQPGGGGHVRRLPGPGQGAVRRRALPRPGQPVGGELHQLGPGHGPDRLLRDLGGPAHRRSRARLVRRADRQLRQRLRRLRRPAHGRCRCASSWWAATPTTS